MGLTPAQVRAINDQKPAKQMTITASGALVCPSKSPVLDLYAASPYNITGLSVNGTSADGLTIEVRIRTGSSAITFTESGNIETTSTSLALGANDSAKFRYCKADDTWYQIATTNL